MSSSDPTVRSQRLALLESYLNATPYPGAPNFPLPPQSENQLPSLRSDHQHNANFQNSSNHTTLPSLNEFIKPIFHTSSQSSSSESSPQFQGHNKPTNGHSNTSLPPMNNSPARFQQGNNNSSNSQFSAHDQNRNLAHRAPSPVQGIAAPSLSLLAHAANTPSDQLHDYQRKDPLDHRFASSSKQFHVNASNNNNNSNFSDDNYRRGVSGYNNINNTTITNAASNSSNSHLFQPSHHHTLQDSTQAYHNPNMHSHRFHTTSLHTTTVHQSSGSSSSSSSSATSPAFSSATESSGIFHNFDGGAKTTTVSLDASLSQATERMEEKKVQSSQAKIEENINLMQMLLNTGNMLPDSESFTEHLLEIYERFHNAETSRLLPAMLAPSQNLHNNNNNSATPMDGMVTENRPQRVNSSS